MLVLNHYLTEGSSKNAAGAEICVQIDKFFKQYTTYLPQDVDEMMYGKQVSEQIKKQKQATSNITPIKKWGSELKTADI